VSVDPRREEGKGKVAWRAKTTPGLIAPGRKGEGKHERYIIASIATLVEKEAQELRRMFHPEERQAWSSCV